MSEELAYLPVQVNQAERFALVYGQFARKQKAASAMSRLPRYFVRQQPVVPPMSQIQRYLASQT